MVLEYKDSKLFIDLANWQNKQDGYSSEIKFLEENTNKKKVKSGKKEIKTTPKEKKQNINFEGSDIWEKDPWVNEWIKSKPLLGEIDLSPYFYVVREKTGFIAENVLKLSKDAHEIVVGLFSASDTIRASSIKKLDDLPGSDVRDIFKVIKERFHTISLQTQENKITLIAQPDPG